MTEGEEWVSTRSNSRPKNADSERIKAEIAAFRKAGGKIKKVKQGASADPVNYFIKPLATSKNQKSARKARSRGKK